MNVDVANGKEIVTAVHEFANSVIDDNLPVTEICLEPDWALQDPNDYIEVFKNTIPSVIQESGIAPSDVIRVGIDFTACTMLPTRADGTPLCFSPEWHDNSHTWVKLWKHHAAQVDTSIF